MLSDRSNVGAVALPNSAHHLLDVADDVLSGLFGRKDEAVIRQGLHGIAQQILVLLRGVVALMRRAMKSVVARMNAVAPCV